MHAHVDQSLHPRFVQQIIDVGLADAGGDAGDQSVLQAIFQPGQRAVEHIQPPSAFIGDDLVSLDA